LPASATITGIVKNTYPLKKGFGTVSQLHQQPNNKQTRLLSRGLPDETVHQPPSAMAVIGAIGVLAGVLGNLWQMGTTIDGVFQMFTNGRHAFIDFGSIFTNFGTVIYDICFLIAFSFQSALIYLVFRIDTKWKRQQTGGTGKKKRLGQQGYANAAVEVVQQIGLFAIWVGLAFVIDTLGDYMFISSRIAPNVDGVTATFLIFLYAVALYALSTIAFVRAWEYLWASSKAKDYWAALRGRRQPTVKY
jgi:hypothetical protein